jgi:phosphopantetheinyl transferase
MQLAEAVRHEARGECHLEHFFRHLWASKEAMLKARGDGLSFEACRTSFSLPSLLPLPSDLPAGTLRPS